jgi:hypothetical protein
MFRTNSATLLALALLLPEAATAQSGESTTGGLVTDESGAVIPGASIHIVNEETGVAVDVLSDEQGSYRTLGLEPGRYRLETTLDGFETAVRRIVASPVNTYATYATSFKSVGLNLNGVPTDAADQPVLSAATVEPEDVRHIEVGIKRDRR